MCYTHMTTIPFTIRYQSCYHNDRAVFLPDYEAVGGNLTVGNIYGYKY